ncbi:MAG TPA: acyl-CoA dehydrogenase family protein [Polyangiales bacterium]|nr:acyl-CoA dehydrogenase family protein [Polyangiales bacterium]
MSHECSDVQPSDFGFGRDEALLREQARKFLHEHASLRKLRQLTGDHDAVYTRGELPAFDRAVWRHCVELGWTALAIPEECGGIGAKMVAVAALVEEVGRRALPSPLIATLIATYVLRGAATDAAKTWLGRVADGTTISLAFGDRAGSWEADATEVSAERQGNELVLDGTAWFVQDAFKVDTFLVAARAAEGICLVAVSKTAPGVSVERDHIFDLTRDQAHATFSRTRVSAADLLALPSQGLQTLHAAWPSMLTIVSADLVGTSEWQLQTTVEYAKARKQFERTIGSFQAVKHPLVDAMMQIDQARSLLYNAACAIDVEPGRSEIAARMAKSAASDAAVFASSRSVQLHGGIGFTWECDVHVFFKRNQHNAALYGDGVHQRRKLANALIGPMTSVSNANSA